MSDEKARQIPGLGANADGRIVEITADHETISSRLSPPPPSIMITPTQTAMAMIATAHDHDHH